MPKQTKRLRMRYINSMEEMNKILERSELEIGKPLKNSAPNLKTFSFYKDKKRKFEFTTAYGTEGKKEVTTFIYDKNQKEQIELNPGLAYLSMTKGKEQKIFDFISVYPDVFEIGPDNKFYYSAKPYLNYGESFKEYEGKAYCYDLNSAYASVLLEKSIDTYNFRKDDYLREGEVGFMLDNVLTMKTKPGQFANYIFKVIESPYKKFILYHFNQKVKASEEGDLRKKLIHKAYVNFAVGVSQNHNPFFRAFVVNSCNNKIEEIMKKYTGHIIYYNTDAIYADIPIPECEQNAGTNIGQWEKQVVEVYRQKEINYQKDGKVCYRGVCNEAFDDDFNILKDDLPTYLSSTIYNEQTNKIQWRN